MALLEPGTRAGRYKCSLNRKRPPSYVGYQQQFEHMYSHGFLPPVTQADGPPVYVEWLLRVWIADLRGSRRKRPGCADSRPSRPHLGMGRSDPKPPFASIK